MEGGKLTNKIKTNKVTQNGQQKISKTMKKVKQ